MSVSGPVFYAWCNEADRIDAFAQTLSALVTPGEACNVDIASIDHPDETWRRSISIEEVVETVRIAFAAGTSVYTSFGVTLSSGHVVWFAVDCFGEGYERRHPAGPLRARSGDRSDLLPPCLEIAFGGGARSVEVEGAILSMQAQQDIEDLMVRFCAPNALARVTTGACTELGEWSTPIDMSATYRADAASVACDLALSWVHLHDGDKVALAAGMSLDALQARVAAAPCGARVAVAGDVDLAAEYILLDRAAAKNARHSRVEAARRGTRVSIPGAAELTREQVLAALATPPATLLEALEASAVPDDEWRAVEPRALELVEAKKQGVPTCEVNVATGKHTRFIQHHAPYHVRRLPSGGVLLATHPYRILWPLWADALMLLGITP